MPRLIINLRGTSGSGKTTVVRKLMETAPSQPVVRSGKVIGMTTAPSRHWRQPLFFIGRYNNVCGGMDTVPTQADCATEVHRLYDHGHVVCEGLLASGVGPKATLPAACIAAAGPNAWFLCLDTPLEVCLERVQRRRDERGDDRPFNPANTQAKWEQTRRAYELLEEGGANVRWLPYETAYEKVLKMLERADAEA